MFERILNSMLKKAYPERDFSIEKVGKKRFMIAHDETGCNDYLLEGTYSYEEIIKLNELTGYTASFGFCEELGSVAFIGIPNPDYAKRDGYFNHKVHEYGTPRDESEYFFKLYSDEEAKEVGNYTVYGMRARDDGFEEISKLVRIEKLSYVYDSRYQAKSAKVKKVYDMDCKVAGTYSYDEAKLLATGTTEKKESFSGKDQPIYFAMLDDNTPVGIIGIWPKDIEQMVGFRTVWEFNREEPKIQDIRFLSDEEAASINNYSLYIYNYSYIGIGKEKYNIESRDRTLDRRFNFHLPDGTDYRLIEHKELFR